MDNFLNSCCYCFTGGRENVKMTLFTSPDVNNLQTDGPQPDKSANHGKRNTGGTAAIRDNTPDLIARSEQLVAQSRSRAGERAPEGDQEIVHFSSEEESGPMTQHINKWRGKN